MSRVFIWGSPLVAAVCVLALTAADMRAGAADWPRFRGPNGDGVSADTGLLKDWPKDGPPLVWKSDPVGIGYSSVALAGKRLFTMGDDKGSSYVFALDRDTGKRLWATKVGKAGGNYSGTRCTPTIDGARVYGIGQFGDLVCLDAATGKEIWRKNFGKDFHGNAGGWNYTESPLVDGDKLVCTPGGQKTGAIVALNKLTGATIWESDLGETAGYASMVVTEAGGARQYVQLLANGLASVSANDGKLLWRYGNKDRKMFAGNTANIPNPVILGDYVFAGAGYGRGAGLVTLHSAGPSVREDDVYFKRDLQSRHGGYVVVGDYIYADTDNRGEPFCAKWLTGDIQWKRNGDFQGHGSAAIVYADGRLYMRYDNGYVALVEASPKAYIEHGTFKIPNATNNSWSHPVVVGGKLYLREKDVVWCYDVRAK